MKRIYSYLALLICLALFSTTILAQQTLHNYKTSYHHFKMPSNIGADEYVPNMVVFKVKPQFRSSCYVDRIDDQNAINTFLNDIGAYDLKKIFPNHQPPVEPYNELGQKYADLSLIYSFRYMSSAPLEKVINKLFAYGIFEYVELKVIPKTCATPYDPNDPNNGSQFSITQLRADSAWGVNTTTARGDTNIVIGITDTGIDFTHSDLDNVKYNYADPINGTDDDSDGYTDNFRGWDVGMNDNNPTWQASNHGVHVTGIAAAKTDNAIGMSGIGFNCKYLPIKISDNGGALIAAYEGITYGADHGCHVINCSWGSGVYSNLGQDVIDYATINKDVLVVAAAGNNASDLIFYPASYNYVLNVAGLRADNRKWGGSNFGYSVDVCTGGEGIYSTIPGNSYTSWNGTSMACPNGAGAAGLVRARFPNLNALQTAEQLKATCDSARCYAANFASFKDKLGRGVINLYRAITDTSSPSIVLTSQTLTDNNDDSFVANDTIRMEGVFTNYLAPTTNLVASITAVSGASYVNIIDGTTTLGVINTLSNKSNSADPFEIIVLPSAPLNTVITFKLVMNDGNYTNVEYFDITVNVDYINIAINEVATTVTSKGLIGYNEDNQTEGLGFRYKNGPTLLYDAALMIGVDTGKVSDAARSLTTTPDADFVSVVRVRKIPNVISDYDVDGIFNDNAASSKLPVEVHHSAYAWDTTGHKKYVMMKYVIKNTGTGALSNLYAGIFADWDIDADTYGDNRAGYDATNKLGYIFHTDPGGIYCGVKVLSKTAPALNYAFDNIAGGAGGIDIANGYSGEDKYLSLSTNRLAAGTSGSGEDVMHTVSTGPFNINSGDSIIVGFALMAGDSLADLQLSAANAQIKWDDMQDTTSVGTSLNDNEQSSGNFSMYPNPNNNGQLNLNYHTNDNGKAVLTIYNMVGQAMVQEVFFSQNKGLNSQLISISDLADGVYQVSLDINGMVTQQKLIITK